jgi:hypothetical protein
LKCDNQNRKKEESHILHQLKTNISNLIYEGENRFQPYSKVQITDCINVSHSGATVDFNQVGGECKITINHDGNKISFNVPANLILDLG